ncbi:MAG TPA: lamin tail domain-containing protein [bacterium]|nr:lamin tail domain-containing protein [bacterium]HPG82118.1 lamin tail domain-containing protein [bacterium]HPM59685.1 lamin tail domain-containing protein [bacterium]
MKIRPLLIAMAILVALLAISCSREAPVQPPPPPPPVYISLNEVYSRGTDADPDWIEIYNSSAEQQDVSGYKLYDSGGKEGTKPKLGLPAATVIPGLGLLVVVVDDTTDAGFGLSSGGEEVWLEDATGKVIDSVVFPALEATQSYGKTLEGSQEWKVWEQVTRGLGNTGTDVIILPVKMNEAFSRGVEGNLDWIEIYNPSNVAVSLAGYQIYDNGGQSGVKPKLVFPAGASAPARGFYVITVDDTSAAGFGLSSGGDEIWLEDPANVLIDNVKIPAMPVETTSYCRIPDGSETWQISNTITKGASNLP